LSVGKVLRKAIVGSDARMFSQPQHGEGDILPAAREEAKKTGVWGRARGNEGWHERIRGTIRGRSAKKTGGYM